MIYNKTAWNTGDVITADKLNNIETGLSNIFSIEPDYDSVILKFLCDNPSMQLKLTCCKDVYCGVVR